MATIVNNPPNDTSNPRGGMGFLLGVILLIVFMAVLFIYILPIIVQNFRGSTINIPSDINVNLKSQ